MPDDPSSPSSDKPALHARLARWFRTRRAPDLSEAAPEAGVTNLHVREFETATVRDVMTSRVDMAAVEIGASLDEVLKLFARESHSRMPVYHETMDEPVGFIHVKDVVAELAKSGWSPEALASTPLEHLKRDIMFVPESMHLPDLLLQMQGSRTHIALVIDEYGGTAGLVSLEDIVEVIVGDLEDEHDEEPPAVVRRGRNVWDVDGLAELDDIERDTGLVLALPEFSEDVDTIGGLVSALAGRVPLAGDSIPHPGGLVFDVMAADPRRVTRVRIRGAAKAASAPLAEDKTRTVDRPQS